ncbi:hypothetical protein AOL_s00097g70 [Orbilia oligospora ATCC 24927]|uniref:Uncharacterized protein n=1 Tax=Arthrobotrys oligospora (strain ATCC 24927 / CBS 115.81 / DSM 1491) TaxID=756982 RepID=G1XI93_ARTOA|nr:hypothetical protein AOL_s00097g70 [Orbilia oligospora ATCC 24927]EGX47024.1 hypothetical protein AOL_s00097g70 [Orbilia oligospora ATCC 24927]
MAEKWDAWGPAEKPGVYPRQNFALAVVAGTPLISLAFTSLRLHAKRKSGWGLDDLTITLATMNLEKLTDAAFIHCHNIPLVEVYKTMALWYSHMGYQPEKARAADGSKL